MATNADPGGDLETPRHRQGNCSVKNIRDHFRDGLSIAVSILAAGRRAVTCEGNRPCACHDEQRGLTCGRHGVLPEPVPLDEIAFERHRILVIMADDIGYWNISAYNRGQMGYRTPNIDRIANEGAIFTDYYGQQSCTAGRAAFITGQSPMRTGLLKVGLPGAKEGLSDKDPTMAELLKPQGYATGQFGKNHLGDQNEFLPTVHGFDEFFGNLYHLNAEDEPEHPDYPKNPAFRAQFGPRGVLKCVATATDTLGGDPRFGPWGKQKCEDTGPLTKKRMETIDDEFLQASIDFIDRANRDHKPFLVWFNPTFMHILTRLKPESQGKTGLGVYPDGNG
jgi:arylsulfatase A-like enzyme